MGEDQHAAGLRGLDEAERRDRLAGAGGVLEPEALGGVGILGLLGERLLLVARPRPSRAAPPRTSASCSAPRLLAPPRRAARARPPRRPRRPRPRRARRAGRGRVVVVVVVVVLVVLVVVVVLARPRRSAVAIGARRARRGESVRRRDARRGRGSSAEASSSGEAEAAARPLPFAERALRLGQQRRERARQRVDLVGGEHGAVRQLRLVLGEHALEARAAARTRAARRSRGAWPSSLQLGERLVERAPARRARGERDRGILAVVQEALAHELLRASDVGGAWNGRGREGH